LAHCLSANHFTTAFSSTFFSFQRIILTVFRTASNISC